MSTQSKELAWKTCGCCFEAWPCAVVGSMQVSSGVSAARGKGVWVFMVAWIWQGCQKLRWGLWFGHHLGDCWL